MRRFSLVAVLALGLAACGGSRAPAPTVPVKITFGIRGGTMMPYSITVAPSGAVTTTGSPPGPPWSLTRRRDVSLSRRVRSSFPRLTSQECPGTVPDESAKFITVLGKTVTVRGTCEFGFEDLWNTLLTALHAIPQH